MASGKVPATTTVRELRAHNVVFTDHLYQYEEKGGTAVSARELGVPEHAVVKTLVMEDEDKRPLVVLMHGDLKVSTRELARVIGVKTVSPCSPETANRHSGYIVGGTSPFGTRKRMPLYYGGDYPGTAEDLPQRWQARVSGGHRAAGSGTGSCAHDGEGGNKRSLNTCWVLRAAKALAAALLPGHSQRKNSPAIKWGFVASTQHAAHGTQHSHMSGFQTRLAEPE